MTPDKPSSTAQHELVTRVERGTTVGRYLVVGLIGKGGMGEVYAAYDPELDRKIALKLLHPSKKGGDDGSEGRSRLLREAQAIAKLSDPNVVVMFDVGTFNDRVFLAMEFVDGNTLSYWLEVKPRGWREVVATFTSAGKGLAAAHRAGLVHRDFKPDNVMMGRDGQVRVMDFGLARAIEGDKAEAGASDAAVPSESTATSASQGVVSQIMASIRGSQTGAVWTSAMSRSNASKAVPAQVESSEVRESLSPREAALAIASGARGPWREADTATRDLSRNLPAAPTDAPTSALNSPLTQTGAIMGTPAYMAPEQFQCATLDARSDQFSFCVALYEALYGQRPFEGKDIHALTANVLAGRVRPQPPGSRVPGWLRRVVLRGLRVDRATRHASMETLLAAMAKDPARTRRRGGVVVATMGLIVALGAGLVRAERQQRMKCQGASEKLAGIWELPNGKRLTPRKNAIRGAFMATGKRYAADSFEVVSNALDRYVTAWDDMHREACRATNVRGEQSAEVLDLRMACLHERFSEVRALTAVFTDANADVVSKAVGASQSMRPVEQCADIATLRAVVRPPDDPEIRRKVSDVRTQLADVKALKNAGRYKQARDQIGPITEVALATNYQPVAAEALMQMGELQTDEGDAQKAEISLEQAVWLAEASRHDEVALESATDLIYSVGVMQSRYVDGDRWARHAASVLARLGPGHDVIAGWRANNLGVMYSKQGRLADSLAASLEAVALKTRALGGAHFDVAISETNAALALFHLGRLDEAGELNQKALKMTETALGPDHPLTANVLGNIAEIANVKGLHGEARRDAHKAVSILEREYGSDHPSIGSALTTIGESFIGEGQPALAIPHLERALRIGETVELDRDLLCQARFALARALNRDQNRALSLAIQARSDCDGGPVAGPVAKKRKADIDRWIEARPGRLQRVSMR